MEFNGVAHESGPNFFLVHSHTQTRTYSFLVIVQVNPWEFLKLASKPFEINARHANVDFDIQCGKEATGWMDRYVMKVDQFKLGQVMRNLMSNALKFTPEEGKVTVRIDMITKAPPRTATTSSMRIAAAAMATAGHNSSSSTVHPARCVARLTVKDTGAGISLENQKKLFGQYVQFNAAQLQKGKGSGLGLWITKSKDPMNPSISQLCPELLLTYHQTHLSLHTIIVL